MIYCHKIHTLQKLLSKFNYSSVAHLLNQFDIAFIGINLSRRFTLSFGKICADYGGYEFDANPINIYEYNNIVENTDNFLTGAEFTCNATKNHKFTFQVLNARTQTFTDLYDTIPRIKVANFASALVGNWRGSFGGGIFSTFWCYSFITEASNKYVKYIALAIS